MLHLIIAKWQPPQNSAGFKIVLSGMKGGHSGIDIPLYRANANKILFRLLKKATADFGR
jgi:dipeptidase D